MAESSDDQVLLPGHGRKRDAIVNITQASGVDSEMLIVGGGEIKLDDSPAPSQHAQPKEFSNDKLQHNLGRSEGAIFETPLACRDDLNRPNNNFFVPGIVEGGKNGRNSNSKSPLESQSKMAGSI